MKLPLVNAPGQFALVDDDYDGEWLSGFRWSLLNGYPVAHYNWAQYGPQGERLGPKSMLRQLSRMAYGETLIPPHYWVNNKNGNYLDCRSANLQIISPQQAALVRPMRSLDNRYGRGVGLVDGFKGMSGFYVAIRGRYLKDPATGRVKLFDSMEAAAREYDRLAIKEWGDRAVLNYPMDMVNLANENQQPKRTAHD